MTPSLALRRVALAALASLFAAPVFAQADRYSYLGLSLGQSKSKIDNGLIVGSLLGSGATRSSLQGDSRDTA